MVSLIIVDYNSIKKTLNYIDNFLDKFVIEEKLNIVIIDNSLDGNGLMYIKKMRINQKEIDKSKLLGKDGELFVFRNTNLAVIAAKENLGYAKGNNLGAQISDELFNDRYYLFSNNDLRIDKELKFEELENLFKKDKNIAVIGPKIVNIDGRIQSPRKYISIWRGMILYYINILLSNKLERFTTNIDYDGKSKYVYWVMGCFVLVDRSKFRDVNGFDENTFLLAEEMILSERLKKRNYKSYFYNDISLLHEHGQTIKSTLSVIKGLEIGFQSNYYYYKNYTNATKISLYISVIVFKIFLKIFYFREYIKEHVRRKI